MSGRNPLLAAIVVFLLPFGGILAQPNRAQSIRYGTIVDMEQTIVEVRTSGSGSQVGATIGAVAGYALTDRHDRWLGALVGGVVGGAAGGAAERSARKKKGWQLVVLLEETQEEIGVQVVGKKTSHAVGNYVRLFSGPGGETQVRAAKKR